MVDVAEPKWRLDAWCRRRSCGVGAHGVWHPEAVKGARSRILRNARLKELWNFWNFGILEFWSSQPYGDAGTAPALWRIAPKLRLARHRCPNTAQLGGGSGRDDEKTRPSPHLPAAAAYAALRAATLGGEARRGRSDFALLPCRPARHLPDRHDRVPLGNAVPTCLLADRDAAIDDPHAVLFVDPSTKHVQMICSSTSDEAQQAASKRAARGQLAEMHAEQLLERSLACSSGMAVPLPCLRGRRRCVGSLAPVPDDGMDFWRKSDKKVRGRDYGETFDPPPASHALAV
ncbi:hypothetical protein AOQ84DRAFT_223230 [Glonium stellatum]|uniref:Uncharacterized protein n=1 Tax=Glonium stellatum TaxID=574774 RepID=A0A8E2JRS4_9PEZI|nr:hypothetical protein AOQ84DRAFT_223230 [Glonium stellatum]